MLGMDVHTSRPNRTYKRIGVLVPFTNTNLEPDLIGMCPPDYSLHFQRTGGYDADGIPGLDQMAKLGNFDLSQDLEMILGARPDVVLYGCTSATLTHGTGFDRDLATQIEAGSGASTFTAAGSLVAALKALDIERVGFSSPYVGTINKQAVAFLEQNGVETVSCADIGCGLGCYGQGELSLEEVYNLAMKADDPKAQAIVLSCTDMRSVEVIEKIEKDLGKPVVTSNQAMMFCVYKKFGLLRQPNLPGCLFDRL
jgi:maleate isomerase